MLNAMTVCYGVEVGHSGSRERSKSSRPVPVSRLFVTVMSKSRPRPSRPICIADARVDAAVGHVVLEKENYAHIPKGIYAFIAI